MHCVIETQAFSSSAEDVGLSEEERHHIVTQLARNPEMGDVIKGTGGARKVRFPLRGKGKRSGVRVVTFYTGEDIPVFLLDIFAKGDRIDLSQKERNEMKVILADLARVYKEKSQDKLAALKERTAS